MYRMHKLNLAKIYIFKNFLGLERSQVCAKNLKLKFHFLD